MAIEKKYVETPLMKQYYAVKAVHPDAILLFRVGDFYETFGDDAIKASGILGITLTRRANGAATFVELAGFPYHAIDTYLPKLVRAGERVAICEQLEDPKQVKGLVKRGVIELVTPGVVLGDNILANKENTYLAAVYFGRKNTGVAFLDISTGEFYAAEGSDAYIDKLISNLAPKEIIYQRGYEDRFSDAFGSRHYTYRLDEWAFSESVNRDKLCKQFGTQSLKGFGIEQFSSGISAAGAILYYLEFTEHKNTAHISSISRIDQEDYVWVDKFTIRNLELFSSNGSREKCAFADVVDRTLTPMGGRLLKRWIALPIKEIDRINERLDVVQRFYDEPDLAESVAEQISQVGDLERIASRIAAARVTPREIVQLKNSLSAIELLKALLESTDDERLHALAEQIDLLAEVRERIAREVYPDPQNNQIQRGGIIADGVDAELDDLRRIALHGKDFLNRIQQRESEATGIPLKDKLQQCLRLLYRSPQYTQGQGSRVVDPQADAGQCRAIYHRRAERVRRKNSRCRGEDAVDRAADLRRIDRVHYAFPGSFAAGCRCRGAYRLPAIFRPYRSGSATTSVRRSTTVRVSKSARDGIR